MMDDQVRKAGLIILEGGTILYPTDTIWGLGCDATNPDAVQKVYQIKQRSDKKSMLVLMDGTSMLSEYLERIPDQASELIASTEKPVTIIYPGARNFAFNLIGKDGSIGIRITLDPFCRNLLKFTGRPIVSTSANLSGTPSPGTFKGIDVHIQKKVDFIVKWRQDESVSFAPSSILKMDLQGRITVLRS